MLFGEVVVIADKQLAQDFPYLVKERGGLLAKGRLLGVQFETAFAGGAANTPDEALYWQLARNANVCANHLRSGMIDAGYTPYGDSTSNQQFLSFPQIRLSSLRKRAGARYF